MPTPPRPMLDQMFGPTIGGWLRHLHAPGLHGSATIAHHATSLSLVPPAVLFLCALAAGTWCALHARDHLSLRLQGLVDPRVRLEMYRWNKMIAKVFPPAPKFVGKKPMVQKAIGGEHTPSGTTLLIHFDRGGDPAALQEKGNLGPVSASISCPVQIEPVYLKPHRALAYLQRRDTLAPSTPWPWMDLETTNFFGPIPVAVDLNGNVIDVDLREKNALLGGEPGGGKTATLHEYIAAAALDTRVHIHIFAGKQGTDFRVWEPICDTFVTDDEDDADKLIPALAAIKSRMDRTYKSFPPGIHTINWDTTKRVDLVVIDEPGAFPPVLWKYELAFNARGRAAGVMSVLATQRPSGKIMDTDLRALYQIRHGHRLEDAGMLMTLGDNYRGFSATSFGPDRPGECWLIPNDRTPVHCRSFFLTDSDLSILAARAIALRSKSQPETGSVPSDLAQNDRQPVVDTPADAVVFKPQLALVADKPPESRKPALTGSKSADDLRVTLLAVLDRGPAVAGPALSEALGIGSDVLSRRGAMLLEAGWVSRARRALPGDAGKGNRVPWLWSATDSGIEALNASRNQRVAPPKEAGAQ